MTASSSASCSRFSPPSNCVNGHVSTMWFIVCRWPQSQAGDWARHCCAVGYWQPAGYWQLSAVADGPARRVHSCALNAQYAPQGLCNCWASVCLSVCPSVCLSVCPVRPPNAAAGLLFAARRAADIDRLLHGRQPAVSSSCAAARHTVRHNAGQWLGLWVRRKLAATIHTHRRHCCYH